MSGYNAQMDAYNTTTPNLKVITDATDANNIYIGMCQADKSVINSAAKQWFITKTEKDGAITVTGLLPGGIETWSSVWDDRATYNYS